MRRLPHNSRKLSPMNADINLGRKIGEGVTADIFAWGENQALKLFKANHPQEWTAQEAFFTKTAYDHGLPVPRVWDLLEVDGRTGIIYDRIDGPTATARMEKNLLRLSRWAKMLAELLYI